MPMIAVVNEKGGTGKTTTASTWPIPQLDREVGTLLAAPMRFRGTTVSWISTQRGSTESMLTASHGLQ